MANGYWTYTGYDRLLPFTEGAALTGAELRAELVAQSGRWKAARLEEERQTFLADVAADGWGYPK